MRRLILLGLIAAVTLPALAAKRVTVVQLESFLGEDLAAHRLDADMAHRLAEFELTERLTEASLGRLAKNLSLGPRTALALQLLADQSAFLEPPPRELPATAKPDAAEQLRMMNMARGYVVQIWPHLPDFFVTRTTVRFDDSPQVLHQGDWPVRAGMHLVGAATLNLTYRDGKEIVESAPVSAQLDPVSKAEPPSATVPAPQEKGMTSRGEFGPELTIVLTDTAKGTVNWSHWEQTAAGLAAVYNYAVPKAASHFEVSYCCLREDAPSQRRELQYGSRSRGAPSQVAVAPADAKVFHVTPGYHGTLAIDPTTGAILRVTLETELKSDDPISRAATVVQYGPVLIGDRRYIFPTRSVAVSMEQPAFTGHVQEPPTLLINQTTFSHYHRLAASVRVLTEAEANAPPPVAPPANNSTAPPGESPVAPAPSTSGLAPSSDAPSPVPAPAETASAPPAPIEPLASEITVSAANGIPDQPINEANNTDSSFQLKLTSRLVDVGIVVSDKKGHAVKDLKAEDFEVYDNGRKQDLRFFTAFNGSLAAPLAETLEHAFTNRGTGTAMAVNGPTAGGATVLLIDEAHIAWPDMANARQQILKFIATLPPTERVGVYTMTALGFRVFGEITTDHAALTAQLNKWMPTAQSAALAQEEETRNRQSFNEVHSTADLNSVNGNFADVPDTQQTVDPVLRTMGSNPGRASLIILRQVARHLSAVAGHKNLVWVSSDNVFADWRSNQVAIDKSAKEVDSFAIHAQEAMNDAHVAVYPMDVSQLESSAIGADIRTRNVELNQAASDTASLNGGSVANSLVPGRNLAEMQQDMHPIQGPIRMVAEATGGRIIRRAGDLAAALNGVVEDGHATYLVSFAPQGPADDQYHSIQVKLSGQHKGLNVRYRTGYLYAKEPSSLKDRFQQAVWRPLDVSEIAVSADCLPDVPGTKVKLNIAANDLGLEQKAGFWKDKLDIFFIQRDDAGLRAQVEGQTLGLRLKPATYQNLLAAGVPFEHSLELKKGMGSVRVLVVDENSGRMGSVTIPAPAFEAPH